MIVVAQGGYILGSPLCMLVWAWCCGVHLVCLVAAVPLKGGLRLFVLGLACLAGVACCNYH